MSSPLSLNDFSAYCSRYPSIIGQSPFHHRQLLYLLDVANSEGCAGCTGTSLCLLGGMVGLGAPYQLGRHLDGALERMQSCTSDPLCAEHTGLQDRSLHEAACHACLFLPETPCERGNKYLDRPVPVPTVHKTKLAFFEMGG